MSSMIEQPRPIILTQFPRGYYFKAGFYMFFGWLWATCVLWLCLIFLFFFLVAVGAISAGFLHGLFGGVSL